LIKKTTFIINPAADRGRAALKMDDVERAVAGALHASVYRSDYSGHTSVIAGNALFDSKSVVACGGDGTAHEIANVLAYTDVSLGILPSGSANDFMKSFDHRFTCDYPVEAYLEADSVPVDLGKVNGEGEFQRYFLNSFGLGLTGRIAGKVRNTKWLKGELVYLNALLCVLLGYKPPKMHIKLITPEHTIEINEPIFAFSIGNGRIEGGKFHIAPEAELNDGLLDVCILKSVPKVKFIAYALKYTRGTQIFDSQVIYSKVRAVELELLEPETMHMDGEVFDDVCGKISIESAPSCIRVLR